MALIVSKLSVTYMVALKFNLIISEFSLQLALDRVNSLTINFQEYGPIPNLFRLSPNISKRLDVNIFRITLQSL